MIFGWRKVFERKSNGNSMLVEVVVEKEDDRKSREGGVGYMWK